LETLFLLFSSAKKSYHLKKSKFESSGLLKNKKFGVLGRFDPFGGKPS